MEQPIRVAVVDDEEILLAGIESWLAPTGPGLLLVATVRSVAALLAHPGPRAQVVVLDLRLRDDRQPGENVAELRAAGFVVVACSSRDDTWAIRDAMRAGAHSYVRKAADPTELRTAIDAAAAGQPYTSPALAAVLRAAAGPDGTVLSGQEQEVLRLYAAGLTLVEVAKRLNIRPGTAKGYLDRARTKLADAGIRPRNKLELRDQAVRAGLLPGAD